MPNPNVELRSVNDSPPADAEGMLLELGNGESGFAGTPVGTGELTLGEFVDERRASSRGESLAPGWVPQTTYWILANGHCAGLLRLRHYLNEALRQKGGHIGYYVRSEWRGQHVASRALALALPLARAHGEHNVMLTTSPDNLASQRVIEANGGVCRAEVIDGDDTILQYWIEAGSHSG